MLAAPPRRGCAPISAASLLCNATASSCGQDKCSSLAMPVLLVNETKGAVTKWDLREIHASVAKCTSLAPSLPSPGWEETRPELLHNKVVGFNPPPPSRHFPARERERQHIPAPNSARAARATPKPQVQPRRRNVDRRLLGVVVCLGPAKRC